MKVMKKIRNLLLLLAFGAFVVTLPSCHKWLGDDEENGVMLNNISPSDVYVLYEYDSHSEYNRQNQLHLTEDSSFYYAKVTKILSNTSEYCLHISSDEGPNAYWSSVDTLSLFILDKEEYEGKTWEVLEHSCQFKQIYHLSGDDIRLLDAKVPYPPSEIMRNMVMVPSYEEAVK